MVKTKTIHTVVTIGPIEFSANIDSKIPKEAMTVKEIAAYPKAAKYLHNTSSLAICRICDSSPFTLKINMSSTPKIIILKNKAKTAIHINKKTVNKNDDDDDNQQTRKEKLIEMILELKKNNKNKSSGLKEAINEQMKKNKKKGDSSDESESDEKPVKNKKKHKSIELLLEYRGLVKLIDAFVNSLPEAVIDGRIHPSFNSMVRTGRMSCSNPNLCGAV